MFQAVFSVSAKRITTISKAIFQGKILKENRGGDRKSTNFRKRENIANFIRLLPATESHYSRNKSKRMYLSWKLSMEII